MGLIDILAKDSGFSGEKLVEFKVIAGEICKRHHYTDDKYSVTSFDSMKSDLKRLVRRMNSD